MPRTALIVPVHSASMYYHGPAGVPAHVTILFPFVDDREVDEPAIAGLVARFDAFEFVLDGVERFADGLPWLHPEPSEPFRALTDAVWARWPEFPPYGGGVEDPTPHVTFTSEDVRLPIVCRASEVQLLVELPSGGFALRSTFLLAQGVE